MRSTEESPSVGDSLAEWTDKQFPAYNRSPENIQTAWRNVLSAFTVAPQQQTEEWLNRVIPDVVRQSVYLVQDGQLGLDLIISGIRFAMSLESAMSNKIQENILSKIEARIKESIDNNQIIP